MWRALTDSLMTISRDTFGEPVIYQPTVGGPVNLVGIFEEASNFESVISQAEIEGAVAFIDFRTCDLPLKPKKGDMIVVKRNGKPFKIIKAEYDGWSRHRLYLREFV